VSHPHRPTALLTAPPCSLEISTARDSPISATAERSELSAPEVLTVLAPVAGAHLRCLPTFVHFVGRYCCIAGIPVPMRLLKSSVFPVALSALVLPAIAQTTWYVDVNAAPPGNGTQASPYASIQHAIDQSSTVNGDTLLVLAGVYAENVDTHFIDLSIRSTDGLLLTRIHGGVNPRHSSLDGFWIGGSSARLDALNATVSRCVVDGSDSAFTRGVFLDDYTTLEHVTVFGFQIGLQEFLFSVGQSRMENCILVGNGLDMQLFAACANGDVVQYSAIGTYSGFGPSCGVGNLLGVDPCYWSVSLHDVHLRPLSPCIDAGDPAAPEADAGDRDARGTSDAHAGRKVVDSPRNSGVFDLAGVAIGPNCNTLVCGVERQ
jgi:hypothetical protein